MNLTVVYLRFNKLGEDLCAHSFDVITHAFLPFVLVNQVDVINLVLIT
jgi:hypothetical protein